MDITRDIFVNESKLTVHYNSSERKRDEDGIVEAFPFYKISILLNDGLEARFVNGDSRVLRAGEIIVFSPYQAHYGRFLRDGHFEYMDIYVSVEFIKQNKLYGFLQNTVESFTADGSEYLNVMLNFADACMKGDEEKLKAYVIVFADVIERLSLKRNGENTRKMPAIIKEAIEYISRDFVNVSSVDDIAKRCGCSKKYLTECFKKQMGITAYEYLIKTKLNNAKGILLSGASVTSACYDSGFSDYSHFIQLFKKNYGITPNRFKNS
jgi:AraC-like DNA-binding protein